MRSLALVLEQEARARGVSILWRKFSRIPRNEGEKVGRRVVVEHEEEDEEVVEEEGVEMEGARNGTGAWSRRDARAGASVVGGDRKSVV